MIRSNWLGIIMEDSDEQNEMIMEKHSTRVDHNVDVDLSSIAVS